MAAARLLPALALLLVAIAGPGVGPPQAAFACNPGLSACQQLNQANAQLSADQTQLADIQAHLTDVVAQVHALTTLIGTLETEIKAQEQAIAQTQSQIDDLDRQIRYSQATIQRRQAQVQSSQQLLDQRVRAADKHDQLNYFELIVSSKSLPQLIRRTVPRQTPFAEVIRGDRDLADQRFVFEYLHIPV